MNSIDSSELTGSVATVKTIANETPDGIMQIHTVYQLSCLSGDTNKTDFSSDKFDLTASTENLISLPGQDGTVLVDTSKGLVFSVTDMGAMLGSHDAVDLESMSTNEVDQVSNDSGNMLDGEVGLGDNDLDHHIFSKQDDNNITIHSELIAVEQPEEPKKRKGGWPKGKRRKIPANQDLPKAPATAYSLYALKRRQEIKKSYPDLSFVEIAKVLGSEWSNMSSEEKEVYKEQANADKKRYVEDLREYQNSEAYKSIMKRNKSKTNASENGSVVSHENSSTLLSTMLDEEGLFCSACEQCFSSAHNLKEHMFGKQHLQTIANACKEEEKRKVEKETMLMEAEVAGSSDSDHSNLFPESSQDDSLDINDFTVLFVEKNQKREKELIQLRRCHKRNCEQNMKLLNEFEDLKTRVSELKQDIGTQRAFGAALATQIDTLRMVPTLFGVINF